MAVGITLTLGAINYVGVKPGAYTLDLLTVVKLIPLVVLLVLGLSSMDADRFVPMAPHGLSALPQAAYLAMFAFQGFEVVPVPAGETRNPQRNAPVALLGSLLVATMLYMGIQLAAVGSTPGLAGAEEPLALMGATLLGEAGARLVASAAVISMVGFCAGVALAGPRYLEALALDGHLPSGLARRHPRFATPSRCVRVTLPLSLPMDQSLIRPPWPRKPWLNEVLRWLSIMLVLPSLSTKHCSGHCLRSRISPQWS